MSMTMTRSHALPLRWGAGALMNRLAAGLKLLALLRERARSRRALAALDDRLLRDIGLDRGMVEAEITKPFWHL